MNIQEVINKHFRDDKTLYFHSSDAHKNIEGDTYLTYSKHGDGRIELYFGGDNGEVCITVTDSPKKLDLLIGNILH